MSSSNQRKIRGPVVGTSLFCLVLAGCSCSRSHRSSDGGPPSDGLADTLPPDLCVPTGCMRSLAALQCDGDGLPDPLWGCDSEGRCVWISGCAPGDYDISACGADDICCARDGTGWPFENIGFDTIHDARVYSSVATFGDEPRYIDDASNELTVSATTTPGPVPSSVECEGAPPVEILSVCDAVVVSVASDSVGQAMVLRWFVEGVGAAPLALEFWRATDMQPWVARAWHQPAHEGLNPLQCPDYVREQPVGGEVLVADVEAPTEGPGVVSIRFAGGGVVRLPLALEP